MTTVKKVTEAKKGNVTNNAKADAAILDNAKALLMQGVNGVEKGETESNIYTFMHLSEERTLSREERNNSKFMRGYRNKLRTQLEKHFSVFALIKKNMTVHNISMEKAAAMISEEKTIENFMTFYKRYYKLNDFSPASVANNQRIGKVTEEIKIISDFYIAVEKIANKKK